ncbi:MAG TPA: hypothetical protein VNF28_02275 [Candidatus Binataceae bacterium]|nr:hypothetical protein [Candidatus Binataceae bacterium]
MVLTDSQIERYSRQIIVPGVGGRAQERLLAACVAIVAAPADAAGAAAYLAGAGVGRIEMYPVGDHAPYEAMAERMRDLNPDVSVRIANDDSSAASDLTLALIGSARAAEAAARLWCAPRAGAPGAHEHRCRAGIIARLDTPGRIALMPAPPPCPLCADADLLRPPLGARAASAGAIAMVAVTAAFRLLAGEAGQQPETALLEFDGYVSRRRALGRRRVSGAAQARCTCEALS